MQDIVQKLEAMLGPWETSSAGPLEDAAAQFLLEYGQELHNPQPADPLTRLRIVLAAGGIVWKSATDPCVALIHRTRYHDWCLPKGKLDANEQLSQAARREVREETGSEVDIRRFAGVIHYLVKAGHKFVFYWEMCATRIEPLASADEVDRVEWLALPAARQRLTYGIERDFLLRIAAR